jgi:AbrB family looped-hinge helix DNA binding protein
MTSFIVRLDTRGRLVVPNEYREALHLKEGDEVIISLNEKTHTLTINPIYGKPTDLITLEIEFGDNPGCLAKTAQKLADMTIDLVMTESKSSQRRKRARWHIIADISRCSYSINEIKQMLLDSKLATSITINTIAHGHLHH